MTDSALWFASRGTGVVAIVLFTLVLVLGILTRGGRSLPGLPGFGVAALHRNASLLGVAFLVVHILGAVWDPYAKTGYLAILIPYTSSYRPLWMGLGAVAFDLMIAVVVTSLLRQRIGQRVWKMLHWTVYASWPIAVAHGLGTGTDIGQSWMITITAVCIAAVVAAAGWRVSSGFIPATAVR